ncbi:MAG: hypothetical protein VX438_02990 [Planctomycetota bacterium]|nr:hypothetical protein [Planctomycetota bacterium]
MDVIQNIFVHVVVIGGFVVLSAMLGISARWNTRRRRGMHDFPKYGLTFDGFEISKGSVALASLRKRSEVAMNLKDGQDEFNSGDDRFRGSSQVGVDGESAKPVVLDDPCQFLKQAEGCLES